MYQTEERKIREMSFKEWFCHEIASPHDHKMTERTLAQIHGKLSFVEDSTPETDMRVESCGIFGVLEPCYLLSSLV